MATSTLRVLCFIAAAAIASALPAQSRAGFDLDNVAAIAQRISKSPYAQAKEEVPEALRKMSYDQWREIRFRPERALWRGRGLMFEAQFFHPGFYYDKIVRINTVDADGVHPVAFSPEAFDYRKSGFAGKVQDNLGFAGFRLHYPVNKADYKDEVIVFLGASYFRAVGKGGNFGLSARGLAINVGLPSGEEFPLFREFWLVRPARDAQEMQILALLDSRSAAGAYRFTVKPGARTVVEVEARIYPREKMAKLGVAPLTSMFFFGENTLVRPVDYRPEVHDSDGLLVALRTGEWIFRPLENPKRLNISAFGMTDPVGFGLMQRDRDFDHYQDLETRQDLRPGAWIAPVGNWGKGTLELVEIPSPEDIHDNIVAYWVPALPVQPGGALSFSYTMTWIGDHSGFPPGGRAISTRQDRGTSEGERRLIVDFAGKKLSALPADAAVRAVITAGSGDGKDGKVSESQVLKNSVTGAWRLVIQVRPASNNPLELRAFLADGEGALTETWSYLLLP